MIELLTVSELAARLKVQPSTVRDWTRRGVIPVIRLSHKVVRYDFDQVVEASQNLTTQRHHTQRQTG